MANSAPIARNTKKPPTSPTEPLRTYGPKDLCESVGISRSTLNRWISRCGLNRFATQIGGKWTITGAKYAEWVESNAGKRLDSNGQLVTDFNQNGV